LQRREQREWSEQYLHGLLLSIPRKSIKPMALTLTGADRNAARHATISERRRLG